MSLQSLNTGLILSPDERARVSKFRETDKDRRVWVIEKADYRGVISPDDHNHAKFLQRKGWFVREVPVND